MPPAICYTARVTRLLWLTTLALGGCAQAVELRLPVTADTGLSSHPSETEFNWGARPVVRIKGIEMMMLARFDLAPLAGHRVLSARFYLKPVQHRFRTLGFSTVAAEWDEGAGTGEAQPTMSRFAANGTAPWGRPGGDFTDVAWTESGTIVSDGEVRDEGDGWLSAPVAPALIEQMACGMSDGLVITDETGQTRSNNDVYTREQNGAEPYLLVEAAPAEPPTAGLTLLRLDPPSRLALIVDAAEADLPRLSRSIAVDGMPLPRRRLPGPVRNAILEFDDLPAGEHEIAVTVGGQTVTETIRIAAATMPPALVAPPRPATPAGPLWVAPVTTNVDPLTGDGAQPADAVRLAGARGEAVFVQLVVRSEFPPPPAELAAIGGIEPRGYAVWYVNAPGPTAEILVPSDRPRPDEWRDLPGQSWWPMVVELSIPVDAEPGEYSAAWQYGGHEVPVRLTVWNHRLPDELTFDVSLNSYGRVHGQYGLEDGTSDAVIALEQAYHRLAHRHRVAWAPLQYSHRSALEWAAGPALAGEGAETTCDFADYDRRWGALLDGSAFADLPRAGVPVDHVYLPFCEGWPSSMDDYAFRPTATGYQEMLTEHALRAPPIEQAFGPAYVARYQAVARRIAEHIAERGWNRTRFHAYWNNKYYYKDPAQGGRGTSWWLLDEPMHRDDWLALRYFAGLVSRAVEPAGVPNLVTRMDISRPQWQRDWLDGVTDLYVVGNAYYQYQARMSRWAAAEGATVWTYGAANEVGRPNLESVAWCLKAWLSGADGVVPWNSIGTERSFDEPDQTGLMMPGRRFGLDGPLPSLRLLALQVGQQECERLAVLAAKTGWSRGQIALATAELLDLDATAVQRFADDAGQLEFANLDPARLEDLRWAVAAALDGQ